MGIFDDVLLFFSPKPAEVVKPAEQPAPPKLIMPEESLELMKKIENEKLNELLVKVDNLTAHVHILSKNVINLIHAYKHQEEMLVAVATLHEELLNQIEQSKAVLMKQQQPAVPQKKTILDNTIDPSKNKKKDDGWN